VRLVASILLVSQRGDHRGAILLGRGGSLAKAVVMEDLLRSGLVQSGLFPITWVSGKRRLRATMKPVRQRIIYAYGAHACMNRGQEKRWG
jgi:hypothetical protein